MVERTNIPSSPACGQWETLLADALDGLLKPDDEATFTAHMAVCPACTALFEDARRGREWLEFLSPEPEVPAGLLDKILAKTGPGQVAGFSIIAGPGVLPVHASCPLPGSAPASWADSPLCRAPPAYDRGDGLFFHRPHAQPDRRPLERPPAFRSSAYRGSFFHGAPADHGFHPHHSLLRPPALCLRSRVSMRELRRSTQGEAQGDNQQQKHERPATPGESQQNPGQKDGGSRVDPPQQSGSPAF